MMIPTKLQFSTLLNERKWLPNKIMSCPSEGRFNRTAEPDRLRGATYRQASKYWGGAGRQAGGHYAYPQIREGVGRCPTDSQREWSPEFAQL